MIFLDTNVVSELMEDPVIRNPQVIKFLASQIIVELFVPSIVIAELRYGIQRLPAGRRRAGIEQAFHNFLASGFSGKIIDFDASCAESYAIARVTRRKIGRPVQTEDALIGGMALAYGATLATRNTDDFTGYGLSLINPWQP